MQELECMFMYEFCEALLVASDLLLRACPMPRAQRSCSAEVGIYFEFLYFSCIHLVHFYRPLKSLLRKCRIVPNSGLGCWSSDKVLLQPSTIASYGHQWYFARCDIFQPIQNIDILTCTLPLPRRDGLRER